MPLGAPPLPAPLTVICPVAKSRPPPTSRSIFSARAPSSTSAATPMAMPAAVSALRTRRRRELTSDGAHGGHRRLALDDGSRGLQTARKQSTRRRVCATRSLTSGGGGVVELATMEGVRRRERRATTTFPERLRSALTARGWVRRPEPRVRFGQPVLPGVSTVDMTAIATARRRSSTVPKRRGPAGRSRTWRNRLSRRSPRLVPARRVAAVADARCTALDELVAIGSPPPPRRSPDERRALVRARHVARPRLGAPRAGRPRDRVERAAARATGAEPAARPGTVRAELRKDAATRRDLLASSPSRPAPSRRACPTQPTDPWLIAAANALFLAGRFFDGMEARGWAELGTTTLWTQLREQVREDGGHESRSPVWQTLRARRVSRDARGTPRRQRRRADVGPQAREGHGRLPRTPDPSRRHADRLRRVRDRRSPGGRSSSRSRRSCCTSRRSP